MLNHAAFEFSKELKGLPENGFYVVTFNLVLTIKLLCEQFTVGKNGQTFGAYLVCSFEGFTDCGVFGHVVCGPAEEKGLCLQLSSGGIV